MPEVCSSSVLLLGWEHLDQLQVITSQIHLDNKTSQPNIWSNSSVYLHLAVLFFQKTHIQILSEKNNVTVRSLSPIYSTERFAVLYSFRNAIWIHTNMYLAQTRSYLTRKEQREMSLFHITLSLVSPIYFFLILIKLILYSASTTTQYNNTHVC